MNQGALNITPCPLCNSTLSSGAVACPHCGARLDGQLSSNGQAIQPGTQLCNGRYQIAEVLGQGGFGITYRAESAAGGMVAIKEFFPPGCARVGLAVQPAADDAADFAEASEKFLEEARTLARFSHPAIVGVHDVFREHNTSYMVMEYLEGQTLEAVLNERGALPEVEAVGYIKEVGQALEVVHEAGLLHRDIKPGNIMICPDGRVVLIDFGTARSYEAGRARRHTIMITPGYAPLEQYAQEARRGPYTDLYALAATLYHLLTGEAPVPATDRASGVELPDIRTLNPQVSRLAAWAVMEGLAMEVAKRPQSARQFLNRFEGKESLTVPENSDPLQQFLDVLQTQPNWKPPPVPAPPATEPAPQPPPPPPPAAPLPPLPVRQVQTIKYLLAPQSIALAPDGSWIACSYAGSDQTSSEILLWDAQTGKRLRSIGRHRGLINSVAASPDGTLIASGGDDGSVRLWFDDGVPEKSKHRIWRAECSWSSRTLAGHTWKVKSVAFSGDGSLLASGSSDKSVRIWDVKSRQMVRTMRTASQRITAMALSKDGRLAASGGWDKEIHLWDTDAGKLISTLRGHKHLITAVAFSPDGSLLASAAGDDTIYLWNTRNGRITRFIESDDFTVSLAFSPDGSVLATGMQIGKSSNSALMAAAAEIQLWDVASLTLRQTLHRGSPGIAPVTPVVTFSADGRFVAGCCGTEQYTARADLRIWQIGFND